MSPSPYSQTQPVSRSSTITRRLASKVLSLIEKYESLSGTRNQTPPPQKPAHLATRSAFHRLGKSVLTRARLFIENATDQTKSSQKLERIEPPKRRFLPFSSKKRKHRTAENESNGFDHDGTISSNSTITDIDGSLAAPAPLVARILPPSFFSQPASSNEQPLAEGRLKSRKWRKRISPPGSRVRDLQVSVGRKESNFAEIKRKLVPPKMSVQDLTERFQEAERACMREDLSSLREADKSFRVMPCQQVILNEGKLSPRGFFLGDLKSRDRDRSFGELLGDRGSAYRGTYGGFSYETPRKGVVSSDLKESNTTLRTTEMVCRDDMSYLNTNFQYMADGSLSNLGYFLLRLKSEAGTPNASTFFTAGSQEPKMIRAYRKTPPPSSFFSNPENKKIGNKIACGEEKRAFYATKLLRTKDIFSPTPMNAVQAAQLRGMVFRYT